MVCVLAEGNSASTTGGGFNIMKIFASVMDSFKSGAETMKKTIQGFTSIFGLGKN